ncbi:sporulation integral membrane protein YtvI [Aureibacillus halotolerans]|uniref:Sporulation integral membrane protein YtvI n=1 Tax=Aureibacillus halotolerans TaxID=1508390 RepID=A0A4R6TYV2_9BACI|nr:sporulation integral membrane protein YtvI [Aureibacillus halotolerans]TDQ39140.1 sporulation integral membrane protein YtvI [Aureibacillus halotolerans]
MNKRESDHLFMIGRALVLLTCIAIGGIVIYAIIRYAYPFVIALLFASMLHPTVSWLEARIHCSRTIAISLTMIGVLGVLCSLLVYGIAELANGTRYLISVMPSQIDTLFQAINVRVMSLYTHIQTIVQGLDADQQQIVQQQIEQLVNSSGETIKAIIQACLSFFPIILSRLPNTAAVFICTVLGTFFMLKEWERVAVWFRDFSPPFLQHSSRAIQRSLKKSLIGFVRAQLILVSISSVLVWIGLSLLSVNYALTIALCIALVDLLPYAGTGLVFIPWMIYAFVQGDYSLVIGLAVLYGIVLIIRQVMEPRILSSQIGTHPLLTLISMFAMYQWIGVAGLVFGPILMVIGYALTHAKVPNAAWKYIRGPKY